ncbi:MAG: L,D-transpeptidase [Blastocatellia bacterium]|nr:L,D-transpeptidase [Blastocatellia bacterium]
MRTIVMTSMALSLIFAGRGCRQVREGFDIASRRPESPPVIEIAPLEQSGAQWKIASPNAVTATVMAPGAERVHILGRPEGMEGDYLELRTLTAAADQARGRFVTELNLTPDFAGQVWAEAIYRDGSKKRTETIMLTIDTADAGTPAELDAVGGSVGTDESARSDKLTGGKIRRTKLIAGEPDVRITINAPAFELTLWQNGKEVSAYHIGIGHKDFPLPVGEREATAIIFNPNWIPAGSAWSPRGNSMSPGGNVRPDDPRGRLSKIKIPLGAGCMIREAANADEIGHAVSHGCILMLGADLLDLVEKLVAARNLSVAKSRIARLRYGQERLVATLDPPVLVDVNYDLQVVEDRALRLYPDVYDRGAFALDSLRAELQSAGVATSRLGDQSLRRMLDQVSVGAQFVINVADIKKGRLRRGRKLPLVGLSAEDLREISLAGGDAPRE